MLLTLAPVLHAAPSIGSSTVGFIDFLVWQVRESGADNWAQVINTSAVGTSAYLVDAPFAWNTGVRVGVDHQCSQYPFDILFAYTHYQAYASNQASGTVASAFDGGYFVDNTDGAMLGLTYNNANVKWQIFYNTADVNLGQHVEIDPVLQLHPYIGLKAASINQKIFTNWLTPTIPTNFTSAIENLRNDFLGIGPTLGVDTTWMMYRSANHSVGLIGNIAGGLLAGHWNFHEVFVNNTGVTIITHVAGVNGAAPVAIGLLGLQWAMQFGTSTISASLGYEAQMWFNQEQFYSLSMGRANRPVSIQGGNLEVRYHF